ncbi:hypothetical protein [Jatrophihabitans endophyticus]|uniref:hypothetical protein n=1 Tax=Jatrophihabitans endophyticus TaxID=1206085 RepID=UPI0019D8A772|nr:hypothetical protein [Jatrophihabitans endophyticus]MBE7189752.1 hypothetical protein [Jatrophihabitans endophyticus]
MRKTLLLVLAVALALFALPATAADATVPKGSFAHCYKILKKGRYNDVLAGARVTQSGKDVRVHGFVAVSKACQKANSIPISRITILHARLKNAKTGKVVRLSGEHSSTKKSIVRSTTSLKYVPCHTKYTASVKISYGYTDGSYVHPFWIHGKNFYRC